MASAKNASQRSSNKKANQNYSTSLAKGGSVSVKNGVKTYSDSPLKVTGKNGISISGESYSRNKGGTGFSPTGAGVITADSIKPNAAVTIPSLVPTKVGDYTANNAGLVGGEFGVTQTGNNLTVLPETSTETTGTDKWASYINSFNKSQQDSRDLMSEQPSGADIQRKLERETGIKRIRQDVNNYTAQLNTITANRDANILKLEGQGRGITDVIIGGQQAAVNKEAAIQALPVQAQLAAAQGNLELAQDHINTWGTILMTDATNKYNQKKELINNLRDFTTTIELKKIEEIDKANERKYQENQALISAKTAALAQALGQEAPASVMNAIKNATTLEDIVAATGIYNGDILGRQAQRASIAASQASTAASDATRRAAEAALTGALTAEDNARFNSTPETGSVRNATKYAEAAQNYKNAMNTYGTGEVFGKGKGALGQAYSALVGATKDYYSLGTLDNGVQKLIALGIAEPSVWNLKSTQIGALDQTLEASKQVIARDLARLNSTTYAGSEELKSLASEADKVINTGTVQKSDVDEFNKAWGTKSSTAAFSPSAFF